MPATPPLEIGIYSDAACTYGDFPLNGASPSISVPWVFENPLWPTSCWPYYWISNGASAYNSTSIAIAGDGSVTFKIYGSSDMTCSGPVFSSFVGVMAQAGDTQEHGKCTGATTGAANFAQSHVGQSSGWVRIFPAPRAPFAVPNGAPLANGRGVYLNFYDDIYCNSTSGGFTDATHTTTNYSYPIFAGYCNGGITVTGGNSALGWASTAWFVGNDCDTTPTTSVMLSTMTCTTVVNFGGTYVFLPTPVSPGSARRVEAGLLRSFLLHAIDLNLLLILIAQHCQVQHQARTPH